MRAGCRRAGAASGRGRGRLAIHVRRGLVVCMLWIATVHARRVVHMPTIGELCPGHQEWSKLAQCLQRQSAHTLVRNERDVRLVRFGDGSRFSGLVLYSFDRTWKLRGELRLHHPYEVLDFARIKLDTRGAYRIDIGMSFPTSMSLDDATSIPVAMRQKVSLVCLDGQSHCLQAITACDVSYRGRALNTFRGRLVVESHMLKVVGDRGNAGSFCRQPELVTPMDG